MEQVILVDEKDRQVGAGEKLAVHRQGILHRAFSIFVVDQEGHWLLQQRAITKYHSGGLWSNTACGHPRPGETTAQAAHRRLVEEMGFDCDLTHLFHLFYKVPFDNELYEHEYDHVFIGQYDGIPIPDAAEVQSWQWITPGALHQDLLINPERYTHWFRLCVDRVADYMTEVEETGSFLLHPMGLTGRHDHGNIRYADSLYATGHSKYQTEPGPDRRVQAGAAIRGR